ncbi:MAG: GNAT family N-acetyltransferase [Candidatus Saganbacteria bacterium]|nr:GNAT family N-acetyltransferase [Candidatus Saganbacteria bacterium]
MLFDKLNFQRLSAPPKGLSFDCSDEDLNDFFSNASYPHQQELVAVTYLFLVKNTHRVAAYFSLLNDAIKANAFPEINQSVPPEKRYRSVPAVKIARLGVDKEFQRKHLGSEIMSLLKYWFVYNNKTGCKFILADAYNKKGVIEFYQKNGFTFLTEKDKDKETRQMKLDLKPFALRMRELYLI